jgi:hypothetical protein
MKTSQILSQTHHQRKRLFRPSGTVVLDLWKSCVGVRGNRMRNVPHLNTDNEGSDQSNTATRIHRHLYHQWHQVTTFLLGCWTRLRLQDVPQLSSFLLWPKLSLPCTGASIFLFESIASSSTTHPPWRDHQPERATLGQTTGPALKRARW